MSRSIAFFDFDGTITSKDTLLEFIKFSKGKAMFFTGFFLCSPWILAWKLKLLSNQSAKEKVLWFFFNGMKLEVFNEFCKKFSEEQIPQLMRKYALTEIKQLQKQGFITVVVSASPGNWIEHWTKQNNMQLLATVLEMNNNKLTGKIKGNNCYGAEKVRRIKEAYNLREFDIIHAYGDSAGDIPMLELAHKSFMRPFRKK
jgi:phosphatidylglycerophosphatase C